MEAIRKIVLQIFAIDSVTSVVVRGVIWFIISVIVVINSSNITLDGDRKHKLRSNVGFFLIFLCLASILVYLLFGFSIG